MNTSDKEKAEQGVNGIQEFLKQFGKPDTHTQITLDILFHELLRHGEEKESPKEKE